MRSIGGIGFAVELDHVGGLDVEGRRGEHAAVDLDAARGNQAFGVAARGDAGPRQPLGDAFAGAAAGLRGFARRQRSPRFTLAAAGTRRAGAALPLVRIVVHVAYLD